MPSWKTVAAVTGLLILGAATLFGVAYANTPIPSEAQAEAVAQESVIYYRDGKTPIARIGMHRESVPISRIPPVVRHAVLAAEDRNFESEHGVSPTGVARALFKTATGGDVQGGSTITQQLARNYYQGLSRDRTVSRKLKEILISIRLDGEREKDEILGLYLNTVSFGRQAYGIQAAARAYFHKDVRRLTASEAAMLAALIQRPGYFVTTGPDTQPQKKALIDRWNYVLNGMVEEGWLSRDERSRQTFPTTKRNWSDVPDTSQAGYLRERVLKELKQLGVSEEMLETGGLRITTTFDKKLQDHTATLVKQMRQEKNLDSDVHFGLAAVDPKTGGVVAAYGGPSFSKQQFDDSFDGKVQPGSSFKPIVLATALDQGISLRTRLDGAYERTINGATFTNDARSENGVYDLTQMTEMSINTAYVDLGQKVGLENVAEMAKKMGIPAGTKDLDSEFTSLPLGTVSVSPVTMASVYSTFAAEGRHSPTHVISQVTDRDGDPVRTELGKTVKKVPNKADEVFSPEVARDATAAMQAVVRSGTGTRASLGARPVAGKTGTTEENKSAWFVGYTPQLSTSVAMWRQGEDGGLKSLQGIGGYDQIYGGTVPADLFQRFMNQALEGEPMEQFGPPGNVGTVAPWAVPKPEPSPTEPPSPTPDPSCTPGVPTPGLPGQPGQPDGDPCVPGAPGPTPGVPPTGPTGPPGGGGVPCDRFGMPLGCDPNTPPSDPPPTWWCDRNPGHPQCAPGGYPGRPRAGTD
ncbi:transglycosylase domain-containing protein [Actinomadura vinacea]|uniref:Transglycosylase domain-containing protein n=1 Tax=Actinomadura vinacea TaxID=115336 RepID=A0ABP5X2A0_9ACTN